MKVYKLDYFNENNPRVMIGLFSSVNKAKQYIKPYMKEFRRWERGDYGNTVWRTNSKWAFQSYTIEEHEVL